MWHQHTSEKRKRPEKMRAATKIQIQTCFDVGWSRPKRKMKRGKKAPITFAMKHFFKCELMKDRYIWLVASQKVTVLNSSSDSFGRRWRWWFFSALWPMGKNSKSLPTKIFAQLLNEHRQMNGQNESCLSLCRMSPRSHTNHTNLNQSHSLNFHWIYGILLGMHRKEIWALVSMSMCSALPHRFQIQWVIIEKHNSQIRHIVICTRNTNGIRSQTRTCSKEERERERFQQCMNKRIVLLNPEIEVEWTR